MKALVLWQPWATLMAIGAKRNETRGWRWDHIGDVAICAAAKKLGNDVPEDWLPVLSRMYSCRDQIIPGFAVIRATCITHCHSVRLFAS